MSKRELSDASGVDGRNPIPAFKEGELADTLDENALVALHESTQSRRERDEYPLVLPAEVAASGLQRDFAEEQCAFVRGMDTVQFQSFLDDRYQVYRRDALADSDVPEPVRHAKWAMDTFYSNSKEFDILQSFETRVFAHRWDAERFLPLLAVACLGDDEERQEAFAIVRRMR